MQDKQNIQLNTVTVFEKKRINELMRKVLTRLRKNKIGVTDIVSALTQRGIQISRAQFDDLMTTRPERDSTLSLPVFQQFIDIIYTFDAKVLSGEDLLDFINVMRVPVSALANFRSYVSQTEWADALTSYGLSAKVWTESIIGRDEVVAKLLRYMDTGSSVVLIGPTGVGKTAVATEVVRRSSLELGEQTFYIDGRLITSLTALSDQLCEAFQLLMQDNLVSAIRLNQYLHNRRVRVVIDDFHNVPNFTLRTLVRYLVNELPQLICIITTPMKLLSADCAPMMPIQLDALSYENDDSGAAILIQRTVVESGAAMLSLTDNRKIRTLTRGSPLDIRMATIHYLQTQRHHQKFLLRDVSSATLEHMNAPARALFDLLVFLDMYMPIHVLKAFSEQLVGQSTKELTVSLQELQAAGFLSVTQGIGEFVLLQNSVRDALGDYQRPDRSATLILQLGKAMSEGRGPYNLLTDAQSDHLDLQLDIPTILAIIDVILKNNQAEIAANVILRWSVYCMRHGHLAKAIVTVEKCIELLPEEHEQVGSLHRFLGELYGIRGLMPQSRVHFHAAMSVAMRREDATAIAELRVVVVGATFNQIQRGGDTQYVLALQHLDEAEAHFARIDAPDWVGRTRMQRAEVLTYGGEQTEALKAINESIVVFEQLDLSEFQADALRLRGTISLAIGDYVAARQDMQRALEYYEESNQIIERLKCNLRLSMLLFVLDDAPAALVQLERGMQLMTFVGGYRYMFSAFDIFGGILQRYGDANSAATLRKRTDVFRDELQMYRSPVLDQIIDAYFIRIPPPAPIADGADVFSDAHTMQEVTAQVLRSTDQLRGNRGV